MKVFLKVLSQSFVRLLCSIITLKLASYMLGPVGMLMYGQIQSFMQMSSTAVSSVTSTGVVKYIASKEHEEHRVLSTAFYLSLLYTIVLFLIFYIASFSLVGNVIDTQWRILFICIPLGAFFYGNTNLIISLLNGRGNYSHYLYYSMISVVLTFIFTLMLMLGWSSKGVMYSTILAPALALTFSIIFFPYFKISNFARGFKYDKKLILSFSQYSLMALTSAVLVYGVQIYLRHYISLKESDALAGIWFSATKLSEVYMGIISVLFSTILIPSYASVNVNLSKEVWKKLMLTVALVLALLISVNTLSPYVISLIYGDKFELAVGILKIYVIGDAFKILSWVFLYVALTKKHTKIYIFYESVSAVLYVLFCTFILNNYGFNNQAYGYVIQSVVSFLFILSWFLIKKMRQK